MTQELTNAEQFDLIMQHVQMASDGPPCDTPHFCGGVYAKEFHLNAGQVIVSHQHNYDHMSILASGKVIVKTREDEKTYTAPAVVNIKAGVHHAVYAVTDMVWFCIHKVDEAEKAYREMDPTAMDGLLIVKRI